MPPRRAALVAITLAACTDPTTAEPPATSYDALFATRELTALVALPNGEAFAAGNEGHPDQNWVAFVRPGESPFAPHRPGHRIGATAIDDRIIAIGDGLETSPFGRDQPAWLEHIDEEPGNTNRIDLDPSIERIDAVAPTPRGDLLVTSWHRGVHVVSPDGDLVGQWLDDGVIAAGTLDDEILVARHGPGDEESAPIEIQWLTHDARPIEVSQADIRKRSALLAIVDAGPHALATAAALHVPWFRTSVGLLARDGSWTELVNSDDSGANWYAAIAVGPSGDLFAVGRLPHRRGLELRAWSNDGDPLWRLEFIPPTLDGAPTYDDACGGDGGVRVAVATDGGIAVGGHDGCSFSWVRVFPP